MIKKADLDKKINPDNIKNNETPEYLNPEKEELLRELAKVKSTTERVELFGKIMDDFWVDAVASVVPWLWDTWSSLAASLYLLAEWKRIGLSTIDSLKILWYQTADVIVWAIPVLWDVSDYFFKANKRSGNIFEKHFEKLKEEALRKWISSQEIENMEKNKFKLVEIMDKKYSA